MSQIAAKVVSVVCPVNLEDSSLELISIEKIKFFELSIGFRCFFRRHLRRDVGKKFVK